MCYALYIAVNICTSCSFFYIYNDYDDNENYDYCDHCNRSQSKQVLYEIVINTLSLIDLYRLSGVISVIFWSQKLKRIAILTCHPPAANWSM